MAMTPRAASIPPAEERRLDAELSAHGIRVSDYRPVDFAAPIDIEARIAETPGTATAKGMFFEPLARSGRQWAIACEARYVPFRDYPLRDYMRLTVAYGRKRYPDVPIREAVRRVGWEAFPAFMSSVAGRVIYTFAGGDVRAALRLAPEAYRHSIKPGSVISRLNAQSQAVLEYRDVWNLADSYQVGVIEGGCRAFGAEARILVRVHSSASLDMIVRW